MNVTVLDETNEDEVTTDNDATATDDNTEDDIDDDVERTNSATNTTPQNDDDIDDYDEGVDGDQSNDNESQMKSILRRIVTFVYEVIKTATADGIIEMSRFQLLHRRRFDFT